MTYASTNTATAPHSNNAALRSNSPYQQRTSQRDNPTQQLIKQAVDFLIQQLEAGKSETRSWIAGQATAFSGSSARSASRMTAEVRWITSRLSASNSALPW